MTGARWFILGIVVGIVLALGEITYELTTNPQAAKTLARDIDRVHRQTPGGCQ